MNVLVLEDQDAKFGDIADQLRSCFSEHRIEIKRAESLAEATKHVYEAKFDLIILDLMMPQLPGDAPSDISDDIMSVIELSEHNRGSNVIAISGYEEIVAEQRAKFTDAGIILIHYNEEGQPWKKSIASALARIRERVVFDFIILCALDKEREAFRATDAKITGFRNIRGLDCMLMEMGSYRGVCIKLPRMGLVNASILAARAIERFSPKIVSMSGICAGVKGKADIGTLIVADMCWEYQAGKWSDNGFKTEHYDVSLPAVTRTTISQLIAEDRKGERYKKGLMEDPVRFKEIILEPMSTGSAVIASKERVEQIEEQHRKMAGLDMEMYGIYKAAELSAANPVFFGAKTVVDVADSKKGDKYHQYGCVLSARFVLEAIFAILKNPVSS